MSRKQHIEGWRGSVHYTAPVATGPRGAGQSKGWCLAGARTEFGVRESGRQFRSLEVFSNGSGCMIRSPLVARKGRGNAHIGQSILPRAVVVASRRRYREPEGRQWQINVCHAHNCRAA
jgi:hypothetical protein